MGKLIEALQVQYPEFIARISATAKGEEVSGFCTFTEAMKEKNILEAMKRVEQFIKKQGEYIYLVNIFAKTDKENEHGEPLYKATIMTRVHMKHGYVLASNWSFSDVGHPVFGFCEWQPIGNDFTQRNGTLNFHSN